MVDMIVERKEMKNVLGQLLAMLPRGKRAAGKA
jgi:hypothetical protein